MSEFVAILIDGVRLRGCARFARRRGGRRTRRDFFLLHLGLELRRLRRGHALALDARLLRSLDDQLLEPPREHAHQVLEQLRVPGCEVVELLTIECEQEAILQGFGPLPARSVIDQRPRAEGLPAALLGQGDQIGVLEVLEGHAAPG